MEKISSASTICPISEPIRVVKWNEYKQVALTLAEAFKGDEVADYFVRTGDRKKWSDHQYWDLHVHIMECLVKAHILKGLVTTIGPNYACVALWMPPGCDFDGFCTMFWSGLLFLRFKLSSEGRLRFFDEFMPLLHRTKARVMLENDLNSWYLVYIGTKREGRGKGYAKALIQQVTDQADREGRYTYLESSNPRNVPLYSRLGFSVVDKCILKRGTKEVQMDIMTRPNVITVLNGKGFENESFETEV